MYLILYHFDRQLEEKCSILESKVFQYENLKMEKENEVFKIFYEHFYTKHTTEQIPIQFFAGYIYDG